MKAADFASSIQKNKQFNDFVLAAIYVKRGDTYLAAQNFRQAAAEYSRAVHDDNSYSIDRWKPISGVVGAQYLIDAQTLNFSQGNLVSLWLRVQNTKFENYNQSNYQVDCSGRRIKTLSSVNYDSAGNVRNSFGTQEWENIAPETTGEYLFNGMCH